MSETTPSEITPKKMARRSVAVALGIACILLVALVGYLSPSMISTQNSYNDIQNQNQQLLSWLDGNLTLLNQTQDNNTNLQKIVNLDESEVLWTDNFTVETIPIIAYGGWMSYAGYFLVEMSAAADISVELTYTFKGLNYTKQADCGTNGTAIFPVMPSLFFIIRFGNSTGPPIGTRINWTLTYYY
jgi:hypothetical protein